MNNKEAIEIIKNGVYPVEDVEVLEMAILAIEKQIGYPVFDISERKGAWKDGYCKYGHYVTDSEEYCHECGQKLVWEKIEEGE